MTGRHVDNQVFDSSFGDRLQVFTHRREMNAADERRLRLEDVPDLLYEHKEPLPGLLGLEMKTTQNGPMLRVGRRDREDVVCHSGYLVVSDGVVEVPGAGGGASSASVWWPVLCSGCGSAVLPEPGV
jgi:hypothetical protein